MLHAEAEGAPSAQEEASAHENVAISVGIPPTPASAEASLQQMQESGFLTQAAKSTIEQTYAKPLVAIRDCVRQPLMARTRVLTGLLFYLVFHTRMLVGEWPGFSLGERLYGGGASLGVHAQGSEGLSMELLVKRPGRLAFF